MCLFVDLYTFVFVAWTGRSLPSTAQLSRPSKRQKAQKSRDQIHSQEKLRRDPFTRKKLRRDSIHSQDPSIASVLAQLWRFRSKDPIESKWKLQQSSYMPCLFNSSEVSSLFCCRMAQDWEISIISESGNESKPHLKASHLSAFKPLTNPSSARHYSFYCYMTYRYLGVVHKIT